MAKKKLTDTVIRNLKAPKIGRLELWDIVLPGFGVRVTENDAQTYFIMYRVGSKRDKQRRLKIGNAKVISLADARKEARQAFELVHKGEDPARAKPAVTDRTVRALAADYLIEVDENCRESHATETRRIFEADVLPAIGDQLITDVTRDDIEAIVGSATKRGKKVYANRLLARLKTFLNWAVDKRHIPSSPAAPIKQPHKEQDRDHALTLDEIRWFWTACDRLGEPFGPMFKLLLLTAQRRDEVGYMEWSEVDFDRRLWVLPRAKVKNNKTHEIALSEWAITILQGLSRFRIRSDAAGLARSPFVFTTTGKGPARGFSKFKARLDLLMNAARNEELQLGKDAAPIRPFVLHDLRRSAVTHMAEQLKVAPHVVDKILNHQTGSIRGVALIYNRAAYGEERREALERWSDYIEELTKNRTPAVNHERGHIRAVA